MRRAALLLGAAAVCGALAWRLGQPAPESVRGKVVLMTGASAGIGRAAAHAFAARGAHVVLVARRAAALREVEAELRHYDARVLVFPADVTNERDLQDLVEAVIGEFGRLDVLVNNAGVSMGGPLHDLNPDAIEHLLAVNLYAPLRLTQLALPWMLEGGGGHLLYVSSVAGALGAPGQNAYAATKAGLNVLAEGLRRELRPRGIHVSVVMPGWTRTEMAQNLDLDEMRAARLISPLIPVEEAEQVAQAMVTAVERRRSRVVLGGPGFQGGVLLQRLAPPLMDALYRYYFDVEAMVKAVSKQGV